MFRAICYGLIRMSVQIRRWQFTVEDFARMGEAGIFSEDDRVELIDGEVRAMSPIGAKHAAIVKRLNLILSRQISGRAILGVQDPILLSDFTEPQPDLAVLRFRADFYEEAHPTPSDVLLVVEVADSSLDYDRDEKIPHYAVAGIPEVWLVDIGQETVTQYTQLDRIRYIEERTYQRGDTLNSTSARGIQLPIDEVFGQKAK